MGSLTVLGYYGVQIWHDKPPIPERVKTIGGQTLFTGEDIQTGQNVWQSIGGQQIGSIWGHGAYVAPDWSADYLHREALFMLQARARATFGRDYSALAPEQQAGLQRWLQTEIRLNTYVPATGAITVSIERAAAIAALDVY